MMRVTGFHFRFFFFSCRCFSDLFLHLKAYLLQSLNSCRFFFSFFSPLVEIVLTACSTLWECNILHGGDIQVNQCQLSFGVTWQPWEIWGVGRELCENCLFVLKRRDD